MAFSADELRVLRGALAAALQARPAALAAGVPLPPQQQPQPRQWPRARLPSRSEPEPEPGPGSEALAAEVREYVRLAEAVDEAAGEGRRLRSFLLADLARYRAALPGSAAGYLDRLEDALRAGYAPSPEDLAVLRTLRAAAAGRPERDRRAALLHHCERLAGPAGAVGAVGREAGTRAVALPGGRTGGVRAETPPEPEPDPDPETGQEPAPEPEPQPTRTPAPPPAPTPDQEPESESAPDPAPGPGPDPGESPSESPGKSPASPSRPVPTPAEVFPPRRRTAQPPGNALSA